MKKIINLLLPVTLLLTLLVAGCDRQQPVNPPQTQDIFGKSVDLQLHENQWLIINYWAHWCEPCLQEIPTFNQLQALYSHQVKVIGINYDRLPNAEQQTFAKIYHINYPIIAKEAVAQFKIPATDLLPTTYLVAPNGRIANVLHGPQTVSALETMLGLHHAA